eukprot:CAMPEP_0174845792 /NCGR_PEP_ID=MMETSP1114-20130205/11935_1 /TAXON_ID=312471 /ORGANISM="Neobodo designis, Strain CCAP 1951/1" /LENGTH=229 /DNA_ID=CAMNT_0016080047 /DNA_START=33 /DNA_END=722 /DNA_ORIENTATION=+
MACATGGCCGAKCFAWAVAVLAILAGVSVFLDNPKHWVFDPAVLKECAQRGIAKAQKAANGNATSQAIVHAVIDETVARYPNYAEYSKDWLFNNAGGAMGAMTVLHASVTEYVIIFGTTVGTEGHTGRYYLAEDFFTIIDGEQWAYLPHAYEREVYRAGDQHYLPRGVAKQYRMPEKCFALEYARGNIPSMMFFGLADGFTSTLDFETLYYTVLESGGGIVKNLLKGKI